MSGYAKDSRVDAIEARIAKLELAHKKAVKACRELAVKVDDLEAELADKN